MLPILDFKEVVRNAPLVAIDLIVKDEAGRILLGKRKNKPAQGKLFVPGGRVFKNESFAKAFSRVTEIELGRAYRPDQGKLIGVYNHVYEDNFFDEAGFNTHYIILGYELRSAVSESKFPPGQNDEYHFMAVAELLAHPGVHEFSKAYFQEASAHCWGRI